MTGLKLSLALPLLLLALSCVCGDEYHRHTNNWAVIVSSTHRRLNVTPNNYHKHTDFCVACCQVDTSRFWSNYRHVANALSLYHSVKRLGIPDSQVGGR